jgi:hypothetical protein
MPQLARIHFLDDGDLEAREVERASDFGVLG